MRSDINIASDSNTKVINTKKNGIESNKCQDSKLCNRDATTNQEQDPKMPITDNLMNKYSEEHLAHKNPSKEKYSEFRIEISPECQIAQDKPSTNLIVSNILTSNNSYQSN